MVRRSPTRSLVAERAFRWLREREEGATSLELATFVLALRGADESTARRVLQTAFADDPRLECDGRRWRAVEPAPSPSVGEPAEEPERVLLLVEGHRPAPRRPFQIDGITAVRLRDTEVVGAAAGTPSDDTLGRALRQQILELLDGAVPVIHDPPGALTALERWLEEPLDSPVRVRGLARDRLRLPAGHDLEALAAALELDWRDSTEPLEQAEALDRCLEALSRPGERLRDLRIAGSQAAPPIPWERYAFDRAFLRTIPEVPGTYRFFSREGQLLYVGKSKNLRRRIRSYFGPGRRHSRRGKELLETLYQIEYEPIHSDLEAVLQEAIAIRRSKPELNVQRQVHPQSGRRRLQSMLILEPAPPPRTLTAYLIRDGRLIDKVAIGPRGGGLARVHRALEDHFFGLGDGPRLAPGDDLDVELITRWLAKNRDRAVAFDPTDLPGAGEVVDRLRDFLGGGPLLDPDGTPTTVR